MKCPTCGAYSQVLATRDGPHETIRRRRECGNGHRYSTLEILEPSQRSGTVQRAVTTAQARNERWTRDKDIQRNTDGLTRAELALRHGLSVRSVRDIQCNSKRRR